MSIAQDTARVREILNATIALHQRIGTGDLEPVARAASEIRRAHRAGGKLLIFGNGGSAADAQHMAAELVNRFQRERPAIAALALTTDTSVLTSIANDYAFDRVFVRQIEAFGSAGDVALGISTSGASASIVKGLEAARSRGMKTIALTGRDGGAAGRAADIHVNVPDDTTARIQEVHATLIHAICELVEQED
jgi:D-sedoheptulose 7-phosphate isomerase